MNIEKLNKKLQIFTYRLLTRQVSVHQKNQGATMVFVLGCGLIIAFLASIFALKSGDDSLASKINKTNKQTQAITEAGPKHLLAEIMDSSARGVLLLNQDPGAILDSDTPTQWQDGTIDVSTYSGVNACYTNADDAVENELTAFDTTGVVDVAMGAGISSGLYTFRAYRYTQMDDASTPNETEGKGTLLIDGYHEQNPTSQKKLFVEFPVTVYTGGNTSLAGIIANDIEIKQTDAVTGTIICTDPLLCPIDCTGNIGGNNSAPDGNELLTAIGVTNFSNAEIEQPDGSATEIKIAASTIPDVPAVPTPGPGQIVVVNNVDLTPSSPNTTITLPQVGDLPSNLDVNNNAAVVYYYYASGGIGGNKLRDLLIDTTAEIRIYTDGDIDLGGNQDIRMSDDDILPSDAQVRIYGAQTNGTLPASQDITIGGTSCLTAIIHAPKASLAMDGGGNGCNDIDAVDNLADAAGVDVNIYGVVWVNEYMVNGNTSNSSGFYEDTGALALLQSEGLALTFQSIKLPNRFSSLRWGEFE